jgi:hypothetical protein
MGNFTLQTSPCSFLKLRIGPWGIPPVLLLCSPLSWRSSFFFHPAAHLSLPTSFPLSLLGARGAAQAARALGAQVAWAQGDAGEQRAGRGRGESRRAALAARAAGRSALARGASAAAARSEGQARAGVAEAARSARTSVRSARRGRGSARGGSVWARTGAGGARAGRCGARVGHGHGDEADAGRSAGTGARERWCVDTSRCWRRAARLAVQELATVACRRASAGGGAAQARGLSSNAGRRGWWWRRKHGLANGWQCKHATQAQVELRARRGGVRAEGGRPQ